MKNLANCLPVRRSFCVGGLYVACCISSTSLYAQQKATDANAPLHALQPDYPIPYGAMSSEDIKKTLDKVFNYLDAVTPAQMINKQTGQEVTDAAQFDTNYIIK